MDMMANTIATGREGKNRRDKTKGIPLILGAKAFPAEKPPKKGADAAPVLTKPNRAQDIGLQPIWRPIPILTNTYQSSERW